MDKFKRGSIWMIRSQNEINNWSLPFGTRPVIIISNNDLNEKEDFVSYLNIITYNGIKSKTRISVKIANKSLFVETGKISFVNKKFLYCYQGDVDVDQLQIISEKLANNFGISSNSNSVREITYRISKSKQYSNNVDEIKKINRTTSDLSLEEKKYLVENYTKAKRDQIAEILNIYPYEKVTTMTNYLRNKLKKKGHL